MFCEKKHYFYSVTVGDAPLVTLSYLMQYKLKMLQLIANVQSTFLWAMSDAHLRMIHSFDQTSSQNRFTNQFELFVQFLAARAESSTRWSGCKV